LRLTSHDHACACNQTEARRFEELAALRTGTMATSLRDRSAVEGVADALDKEPATVYAMLDGRIKGNPLSQLCRWVDACIATKGAHNPVALEPVRLLRRRYLDPQGDERQTSPALVIGNVAETMEAVTSLLAGLLRAASPGSEDGEHLSQDELIALEPLFEPAERLFAELRLVTITYGRRAAESEAAVRSIKVGGGSVS
jgi:hypothetical protein